MTTAVRPTLPVSPYRGLAPFGDSDLDALFFFGRERDTEIVTANLIASKLTVLYGPSGVGKTSLIRAGVARELRALPEAPEVVVFDTWQDGAGAATTATREAAAGGRDVYLILDQLEEYFLYRTEGDGFVQAFAELVNRRDVRARVAIGIRDDALAQLDAFKAHVPALFGNYLRLDHLDRESARAAITGPVRRWNELHEGPPAEVEEELVAAVLDEVAAGRLAVGGFGRGGLDDGGDRTRIEAPYLQLVMERLWEVEQAQESRTLRLETLRRLGGAGAIVRTHLEHALGALTPEEKDAAAQMFDHLVTPSGTKIAHRLTDLAQYSHVSAGQLEPVVSTLGRERILRPLDGEDGGARYEIFHDVLADAIIDWRGRHEAERALELERAEYRRRQRRLLAVTGVALVALAAIAALAVFALTQRSAARRQAQTAQLREDVARRQERLARARALVATAVTQLESDPTASLGRALAAARLERTAAVAAVLREALNADRLRLVLPAHGGAHALAIFDPRRPQVLAAGADGVARVFDTRNGRLVHALRTGSPVVDAAYGDGGRLAATASADGAVSVWHAATGTLLRRLHESGVTRVVFSPRGSVLATADRDGTARIRDAARGRVLHELPTAPALHAIAFSHDGTLVALAGRDHAARVYSVAGGTLRATLPTSALVTGVAFAPAGAIVATGAADGTVRLWNLRTLGPPAILPGHRAPVRVLRFSQGGHLLLTAGDDGKAFVWNVARGEPVSALVGHTNAITDAQFSPDAATVVTAGTDGRARVWETAGGRPRDVLTGHGGPILSASFDSSGTRIATASTDGSARIWEPSGRELALVGRHRGAVATVSVAPAGGLIASSGADRTVRIWRLGRRGAVRVLRALPRNCSLGWSDDGGRLATGCGDGRVRIWDVRTRGVRSFLAGSGAVSHVAFAGPLLLAATDDGTVTVRPAVGGKPVTLRPRARLAAARFSPDGTKVLAAAGPVARIFRSRDGKLLRTFHHGGRVLDAEFSYDGSRVVTAGTDRTARIWDAESDGGPRRTLRGHTNAVLAAAFSRDGRLVVTGSRDHDARIWSVRSGRSLLLRGHVGPVTDASFSPDGRWVVTAGSGTAGLWQARSGRPLAFLRGHLKTLTYASFTPDGTHVVTASDDGTVRAYRCSLCGTLDGLIALAEAREARLARPLAPAERRRYLPRPVR